MCANPLIVPFFFFNDTATTEIYTLSLHDALPILNESAGSAPKVLDRVLRQHNRRSKTFRNVTADMALHGKHSSGSSGCAGCRLTYCRQEPSALCQAASTPGTKPPCLRVRDGHLSCADRP